MISAHSKKILTTGCCCFLLTVFCAYAIRMLEWPVWQNPEYSLNGEMLLATHDSYHWVAGACGFGRAIDHPMANLLRLFSWLFSASPANVAFWLPPVMASLVAGIVFLWGWMLGNIYAGMAAGLLASIAPGFLGRTLLGFYDTDLVTLLFPLLMSLIPAFWLTRFIKPVSGLMGFFKKNANNIYQEEMPENSFPLLKNPLSALWITGLLLSGLIACYSQSWHSFFPYLIRCDIGILFILSLVMARTGQSAALFLGSGCWAITAIAGPWGVLLALVLFLFLKQKDSCHPLTRNILIIFLWACILWLFVQGDIYETIIRHIGAYLKKSADTHIVGGTALPFPSVAQSIIEVQDLSLAALFPYFHPWLEASLAGACGFVILILRRPGALFLLPLGALGFLSSRLGGRMVMFGAPVAALGIAIPLFWLALFILPKKYKAYAGQSSALMCMLCLIAPFLDMIPALSQGPIINRRHAAALLQIQKITPQQSELWVWWDWGYAAQYFSRRSTIADGAEHGGPSLYLPAAVYATDNARFARQIIRYASLKQNEPGQFFAGMKADEAQELINRLRSKETPLTQGTGSQYLVVSFELLKLGFWISNYGNWNFIARQGEGGALSIIPQALSYRLSSGEIRLADNPEIILPASINIFEETGLTRRNYIRQWFEQHPKATEAQKRAMLSARRNINFLLNKVTDEKLAMDENIYNSLMVQLLICGPHDPRFSPYFNLLYDNIFARVYEVLP